MMQPPSIARMVIYRSRTGGYDVPAMINATRETLYRPGVDASRVPDLSSDTHVHLTVFSPGLPMEPPEDAPVPDGGVVPAFAHESSAKLANGEPVPIGINLGGTYQEWDVPYSEHAHNVFQSDLNIEPGTWRWPTKI